MLFPPVSIPPLVALPNPWNYFLNGDRTKFHILGSLDLFVFKEKLSQNPDSLPNGSWL